MNNIEYDAVVESAKIKAKSDITVAVLNNAASTGLVAINRPLAKVVIASSSDLPVQRLS
ncbi:hypothetical protein KPE73_14695 [Acinetobacter nosocomialis]|nr:hypothetical protein [Acinetobacter nosocomialis]